MDEDATGEELLDQLDSTGYRTFDFIACTKDNFGKALTTLKDHFTEAAQTKKTKTAVYMKILYARCYNDLTSGFHLAIHGYPNQFFAVTRSILESLDLIDLLDTKPNDAKRWLELEDDSKKRFDEFKPSEVRKKLGRPTYNEIYGHWCEMGSHPSTKSFHPIAAIAVQEGKPNSVEIQIGSTAFVEPIVEAMVFAYFLLIQIEISLVRHLPIDIDKQGKILMDQMENFRKVLDECIQPQLKEYETGSEFLTTMLAEMKKLIEKFKKFGEVKTEAV